MRWVTPNVEVAYRKFRGGYEQFDVYDKKGAHICLISPEEDGGIEHIKGLLDAGGCPIADNWEDGKGGRFND